METKSLILQLWRLEDRWNAHCQPGYNSVGLYSFRRITSTDELRQVVQIQDEMKAIKKKLFKLLGFKYLWFFFAPISFMKSN